MPDSRTNSSIPERLDLKIERLPNRLHRSRRWVTLACGLVPLAFVAVWTWRGDQTIYLSRPVAVSHELAQLDCKSCHQTPWQPLVRLASLDNQVRSVHDKDCQACHRQRDKRDHNRFAMTKGVPDCAVCHQEHRGMQRLTERADEFCMKCHASFEKHPEFALHRPWPADPPQADRDEMMYRHLLGIAEYRESTSGTRWRDKAKLHFNHKDHLKPLDAVWDMESDPEGSPKTVQLHCSQCHLEDASGSYMRPIEFEEHCQRCHPLRFSGKLSDQPLPHEKPEIVHGVLRDRLMDYLREHPDELDPGTATRPRLLNRSPQPTAQDEWTWVEEELRLIETTVFQTVPKSGAGPKNNPCQKCHVTSGDDSSLGFRIVLPSIPTRWLAHSRFDHSRHRDVACITCHHVEDDATSLESTSVEDILMPKLEVCQSCHGTSNTLPTARYGRKNCVECHLYHHDHESNLADAKSP